jgi:nucleoside-diphosphate-sugar epimerase
MAPRRLIILGATQGVGQAVLDHLSPPHRASKLEVHALSRQRITSAQAHIHWHSHDLDHGPIAEPADAVISLGPIQYVIEYLRSYLNDTPPQAIWVLSSASTDFKLNSPNAQERSLMASIREHEDTLVALCQARGIHCQLFKTTLLYGRADHNINRLAGLIARLRWVPVVGAGLRSPVHVDDVGALIVQQLNLWLEGGSVASGVWRLQGGSVLTYPHMLQAIADARGLKLSLVRLPLGGLRWGLAVAHALGRLGDIDKSMLERQRQDLVVDDQSARADLGWQPRAFSPTQDR